MKAAVMDLTQSRSPGEALQVFQNSYQKGLGEIGDAATSITEGYLAPITIVFEGVDVIVSIGELMDGKYTALAGLLPIIPKCVVQKGFRWIIKDAVSGKVIGIIDNVLHIDAIKKAEKLKRFSSKIDELKKAGITDEMIELLVYADGIEVSKARKTLRARMEKLKSAPLGSQAHHDLPWEFRREFASKGLDVNEAEFGRWVHPDDHQVWHTGGKFNDEWKKFLFDADGASLGKKEFEIRAKLTEIREKFKTTE